MSTVPDAVKTLPGLYTRGLARSVPVLVATIGLLLPALAFAQEKSEEAARRERWGDDIAKFEASDQAHPPAKGQILFIGSSSIRMWDLGKSFPDLETINRGFGGSEIADSVLFFDRIVTPYQPRQVVLYAGDNDLANGHSPEDVTADFQEFVDKLHQVLPETPLVFIPIKPSISRWKLIDKIRDANTRIRDICEADKQLTFLEIEPHMLGENGEPKPELFADDGLHLNEKGYQLWTELLRPHLKTQTR